jgi:hypothetical protein
MIAMPHICGIGEFPYRESAFPPMRWGRRLETLGT